MTPTPDPAQVRADCERYYEWRRIRVNGVGGTPSLQPIAESLATHCEALLAENAALTESLNLAADQRDKALAENNAMGRRVAELEAVITAARLGVTLTEWRSVKAGKDGGS